MCRRFEARKLIKADSLQGAWSSDGTILIKDNDDGVHRVSALTALIPFGFIPPASKKPDVPTSGPSTSAGVTSVWMAPVLCNLTSCRDFYF